MPAKSHSPELSFSSSNFPNWFAFVFVCARLSVRASVCLSVCLLVCLFVCLAAKVASRVAWRLMRAITVCLSGPAALSLFSRSVCGPSLCAAQLCRLVSSWLKRASLEGSCGARLPPPGELVSGELVSSEGAPKLRAAGLKWN